LLTPIKEQAPPIIKDTVEIKQEDEVVKNEVVDSPKIESEVESSTTTDLSASVSVKQEPLSDQDQPEDAINTSQ